jgi:hypothetical protein
MKTRGSFFGLLALALTLLSLTLASMLGSSMDVLAQDASPAAASPVASPAAASDCGTIMQIGSADDTCLILIQASEAAGDLDLYIDGFEAVRKLSFTNVSGYFALPAGSHDLALVPAGGALGDAVLTVDNAQTEPGTAYELAVI